jgi:kinetochore protein Spc24
MDDENALKLALYRGLGCDIKKDEDGGEYKRVVVRNMERGDVHVLQVEREKYPRSFYAKFLWERV